MQKIADVIWTNSEFKQCYKKLPFTPVLTLYNKSVDIETNAESMREHNLIIAHKCLY